MNVETEAFYTTYKVQILNGMTAVHLQLVLKMAKWGMAFRIMYIRHSFTLST
jgi:hypothetical protein